MRFHLRKPKQHDLGRLNKLTYHIGLCLLATILHSYQPALNIDKLLDHNAPTASMPGINLGANLLLAKVYRLPDPGDLT